jgi:putrescine transport system permease protein
VSAADRLRRAAVVAAPFAWLFVFFLVPFLIVLKISLSEPTLGAPPYEPMLRWAEETVLQVRISLASFDLLLGDSLYLDAYLGSLRIAAVSTVLCLLIGYPMALAIARARRTWRLVLLMLVILPFWTSFLIRVYAWMGILRSNGVLNNLLLWLGLIDEPLRLLNTDVAVYLGVVYSYLPFMILPLYAALEKLDDTLLEAAADLGCRPWQAFLRVTLPLSAPGILAGSLLVFIPATGELVIPELLGGPDTLMIGRVLWTEFSANNDWPLASAVAVCLLVVLVLPMALFQTLRRREG